MNTDDRELQELRELARAARFEPDAAMVERVRAGVAARLSQSDSIWELLVWWFRPVAAAMVALLLILGILLGQQQTISTDLLARATPELSVDEELYGDAQ